jgi:hypothetical protein
VIDDELERHAQDMFEELARSPGAWERSARILFDSAELIWKSMDVAHQLAWRKMNGEDLPAADIKKLRDLQRGGPFMLLAGLAVENLLKAIWVKQHPGDDVLFESDSDGKRRLSRKLTHHRLGDLAQAVGFQSNGRREGTVSTFAASRGVGR